MQLAFADPAPALAHLVATYYLLSEDYSVMEDVQRADTGHLRIFLDGSGYYEFSKGKRYQSTKFFLNGPFTQHMRSVVQGPVRFIGVALFPESWGGLIGRSAADFTDRAEDAAPLLGDDVIPWFDQLQSLSTIDQMAPVMDAWLMAMIKPVRADRRAVIQAIRAWLADSMFPDIADLYAGLSLSERQIMRISNSYFGSPPRALARTYGALKTASAIVMNDGQIPDEAIEHYADQPHLIREIKRVTGQTPRQLMNSSSPVMRITLHPSNFKELEPLP
jgi:AraC-like DNA-binding protein